MINKLKEVLNIFLDVSSQKDLNKTLETIVQKAKEITNSDGGSVYMVSDDKKFLEFKVVQTDSLDIKMGGTTSKINWPQLPMYIDGIENREMVAVLCALTGEVINIEDAYESKKFNFEGTKKFDASTKYRSKSMLVVPLRNHELEIIGVLQLINKLDNKKESVSFDKDDEYVALSLGNLASTSMTKTLLIHELELMLESLIQTIGIAIDDKSKYTGGHIRRVALIAELISKEIDKEDKIEKFKKIKYSAHDFKIIKNAGWLHDIGKIITPESIMDKSTKLETIYDRIEEIRYKIEIMKKDEEIKLLKNEITEDEYKNSILRLNEIYKFIETSNKGGEYFSDDKVKKLEEFSKIKLNLSSGEEEFLNKDELYNLSIQKGTLNAQEREKIQLHAYTGLKMLNKLYFPSKYKDIKHIAANHHEQLSGKGYPQGLDASQLTIEDRVMAIADIFEALTAADRPYKEPKKLSEVFKILSFMAKENALDREIIGLFIHSGAYLDYAKELKEEQLDNISEEILEYFKI
jgi:HD-GYP domain-containing protein (c-di-GMP phosphodiesterase class II)